MMLSAAEETEAIDDDMSSIVAAICDCSNDMAGGTTTTIEELEFKGFVNTNVKLKDETCPAAWFDATTEDTLRTPVDRVSGPSELSPTITDDDENIVREKFDDGPACGGS